jgi:hypothetical protein
VNPTKEEVFAMMQAHANSIPETPPGPIPRRDRPLDKTSMSYWFPLIEAAGLPVPKTKFVEMTDTCRRMIWDLFDGKSSGDSATEPFFERVAQAAAEMGYPCFFRTDHTSGKHSWKKTCYLAKPEDIPNHVANIAEFSECAGMMGIPWDTWAVREFLPTIPYGVCPRYDDFPVCKEFRFFVNEGDVICWHPYWPLSALQDGGWEVDADEAIAYSELCHIDYENLMALKDIASRAGVACGGSWSVDLLETERGWVLTDMAEAHKSYHWEGCEHGAKR